MQEENITWRSFWCGPESTQGRIPSHRNVQGWPTIYVIDAKGVIRYRSYRYDENGRRQCLDTDGKVTDAGNGTDTGRVLAVNQSQWRVGFRREIAIETERDIQKRQNLMVVSMRIAFNERTGTRSTATHTALQYNITGVA